MKKNVYQVEVEVGHMEGTELPDGCGGGFVNVYIGAESLIEAIKSSEENLLSDCYKPLESTAAFVIDLEDYEEENMELDEEERGPNQEILEKLQVDGGIWYGAFHLYPIED